MDLVTLWEHVPPLLIACTSDGGNTVLRSLRLVSKEASRVALLVLKSLTVTLTGSEGLMSVRWARLLNQTLLTSLDVHLLVSGSNDPSLMLSRFVHDTQASLHTITSLGLRLQNNRASAAVLAGVDESLDALVSVCPVLTSFSLEGRLSPDLILRLGEACPLLFELTVVGACKGDQQYLDDTLLSLQPTLLPQITTLTFQDCKPDFQLINVSTNSSIICYNILGFKIDSQFDWYLFPCMLQHFSCGPVDEGPAFVDDDEIILPSLLSLRLKCDQNCISGRVLAQILDAAPALEDFQLGTGCRTQVYFSLTESFALEISDEFFVLLQAIPIHHTLQDVKLKIDCCNRQSHGEASMIPCIEALPCMTGVVSIELMSLEAGELGPMLTRFPDVRDLNLGSLEELTDVELQEVAACLKLTTLKLIECNKVSPIGVLSICQLCPSLTLVSCLSCPMLRGVALEECVQLLRRHGLTANVVDTTVDEEW